MPKKLVEIASELVQTQAALTPMSTVQMTSALKQVFKALQEMQTAEEAGTPYVVTSELEIGQEAMPAEKAATAPENSIQNDKIVCLECGAEMRQLTSKHLVSHGLNPKEYRKKYGFPMKTPLSAKSLTKARSKAAKKRGLPENLLKYLEQRKQAKEERGGPMEEKPKRAPRRKKVQA